MQLKLKLYSPIKDTSFRKSMKEIKKNYHRRFDYRCSSTSRGNKNTITQDNTFDYPDYIGVK